MGDEGVGVKAIEYLKDMHLPSHVELLDGGTGGFHLLSLFDEYPVMIMIDATIATDKAGIVKHIKPKFAADFPRSLTSHDIGLRDLMQSAELLGKLPEMHLITVSIFDFRQVQMQLTPETQKCLPVVHATILSVLKELEAL